MLLLKLPLRHFDAEVTLTQTENFLVDSETATILTGKANPFQLEFNGLHRACPGVSDRPTLT